MNVDIVTLPHFEGLSLPAYETSQSAGMDLRSAESGTIELGPLERRAVATGLTIAIPPGYEGQVRPRSGLSLKKGLTVINSPGTVDADYRGEILIPLVNLSSEPVQIERGMRIAQIVFAAVTQIQWRACNQLPSSERGAGGFGHTGTH